jgi:hypothetical protein
MSDRLGSAARPISPTTKECNSRVRKHFGSRKERCYNRLTEAYFSSIKWIFPRKIQSSRGEMREIC